MINLLIVLLVIRVKFSPTPYTRGIDFNHYRSRRWTIVGRSAKTTKKVKSSPVGRFACRHFKLSREHPNGDERMKGQQEKFPLETQ